MGAHGHRGPGQRRDRVRQPTIDLELDSITAGLGHESAGVVYCFGVARLVGKVGHIAQ